MGTESLSTVGRRRVGSPVEPLLSAFVCSVDMKMEGARGSNWHCCLEPDLLF